MVESKKQYVYIGQYYHIGGKELPSEYKFGVTDNLQQREYSLSRTKSPIKYMILRAWELPSMVKREKVEKIIEILFSESKYPGCEWYDVDPDTFQEKITLLFLTLTDMFSDEDISFVEVDLNNTESEVIDDSPLEKEIRKRRKSDNLKIVMNGDDISQVKAVDGFREFFLEVYKIKGNQLKLDFTDIIFDKQEDYTTKLGDTNIYLKTEISTQRKKNLIERVTKKYNLNCVVEMI
jgi:hypothetical protein